MNTSENQKTILLVEDDAIIAMAEQMDLEAYGYAVIIAHTGEHAVEICRTNTTIDLILMDIDLGAGISGSEAAIQILKVRRLPLIFLSSHTDRDTVSQVEKIAFNGYIVKGSSVNVIVSAINMAFRLFYVNLRLEAEKAYHEAILNSIGDVVIAANAETGVTFINQSALNLTGWHHEEALGRPIEDIFSALDSSGKQRTNKPLLIKYFPASDFAKSRTLILAA